MFGFWICVHAVVCNCAAVATVCVRKCEMNRLLLFETLLMCCARNVRLAMLHNGELSNAHGVHGMDALGVLSVKSATTHRAARDTMCRAAGLAVNATLLLLVMAIIGGICMGVGGYAVKFYQNAFDTTQITGEEFRQYDWELSLYFTAAVEGAILCFLVLSFVLCNALDACWMCTSCCCTHFVCTPLVHHCCLGGTGNGRALSRVHGPEDEWHDSKYGRSRYRFSTEVPMDEIQAV